MQRESAAIAVMVNSPQADTWPSQGLSEEARLSGQGRSQLIREALEALLLHRREERAQAVLRKAAQALRAALGLNGR